MEKLLYLYSNCEKFIYRVQKGESLLDISKKFSVPPQIIIKTNNIDCELRENSLIYLEKPHGTIYVVKPCDTISSIAAFFGVAEQKILADNLTEYIFPYQMLIIKSD